MNIFTNLQFKHQLVAFQKREKDVWVNLKTINPEVEKLTEWLNRKDVHEFVKLLEKTEGLPKLNQENPYKCLIYVSKEHNIEEGIWAKKSIAVRYASFINDELGKWLTDQIVTLSKHTYVLVDDLKVNQELVVKKEQGQEQEEEETILSSERKALKIAYTIVKILEILDNIDSNIFTDDMRKDLVNYAMSDFKSSN